MTTEWETDQLRSRAKIAKWVTLGIMLAVGVTVGLMFGLPVYGVWQQRLTGEAVLARSESARRVLVMQAQAEKESAQLRADAIAIVGRAAQQYPEYRHQEFMGAFGEALREGNVQQIIYVPTEANIPIMEARPR